MPVAELHFFHADDPNGATIFECSTDDEWVKGVHLNIERDSLGGGTVTFARKVPAGGLFQREIIEPETLVRVLLPAISATKYYHGFFINPRQQQVISKAEQGGEGFIFGGPGPKHYLERMLLWSASFSGFDNAVERDSGVWTWPETARAGAILSRLIQEDTDNPNGPWLPDLTKSFGDTNDSDSVPWAEDLSTGNDDFSLRIQDDYLKILWTLEDLTGMVTDIDLGEVGAPLLQLNAYQTYGEDLTADILFEEGVNIAADLDVEGSSYAKASHALVKGDDGVYELAVRPGWSPGELKKVVATSWDTSNNVQLDLAGERFLRRQQNGERQIKLHIIPGTTALAGEYFPGPPGTGSDFWTGDTVSLTTGMGSPTELDYDDEPQAVTGIELELTDAVRDDTTLMAARSWDVVLFLNKERKSSNTSRDLAGNRGTVEAPPQVLRLCRSATEGTSKTIRLYYSNNATPFGGSVTADAAWADGGSTVVRSLTTTPDGSYSGGGSGTDIWSAVNTGVSNRLNDAGLHAIQITDADLLAAVQAGGMNLTGQIRFRSRYGVGINEASQDNVFQWVWRVWRGGGTGFVGTMLAAHSATAGTYLKFVPQSTARNRTLEGTAAAVAGAALNDWIIVETGARHIAPTSGGTGARVFFQSLSASGDLPVDQTTQTALNSWIEMQISGSGATTGDLPLDTVRQDEETAGDSARVARCDHQHAHGLLAFDGSNYHDLSHLANYIVDAAAAPTVTDDGGDGYVVGTLWIDHSVSPEGVYILVDPTVGAAVWTELTPQVVTQTVSVRKNSAGTVFTRGKLNLIEGSNVTLTVADDAGNDEIDITIDSSGGGGGSAPFPNEYIGTCDPRTHMISNQAAVANRATMVKFRPTEDITVSTVNFRIVTTGGNIDFGIYDLAGNRLASTGSFAAPSSATSNTRALSGSVNLVAFTNYWLAISQTSTNLRLPGAHPAAVTAGSGYQMWFVMDTAFPLPDPVTLPSATPISNYEGTFFLPAFYFTT